MDPQLIAGLRRLERAQELLETAIYQRIDRAIREAERLAHQVVICPDCGARMVREPILVTCPHCGLSLSDSDAPTAQIAPVPPLP